jgi:hypothetical protein
MVLTKVILKSYVPFILRNLLLLCSEYFGIDLENSYKWSQIQLKHSFYSSLDSKDFMLFPNITLTLQGEDLASLGSSSQRPTCVEPPWGGTACEGHTAWSGMKLYIKLFLVLVFKVPVTQAQTQHSSPFFTADITSNNLRAIC